MAKALTEQQKAWYRDAISQVGGDAVSLDAATGNINYSGEIASDESHSKYPDPEEFCHAVTMGLLARDYGYPLASLGHEIHFAHGSAGSKSDEVDILLQDSDNLPYALIELKSSSEFDSKMDQTIRYQLFGTAPLLGPATKLLVYATVHPTGSKPTITCMCIDYTKHKDYDSWVQAGSPHSTQFPADYVDLDFQPFVSGSDNDLKIDATQADFRAVAMGFHNEFFGEHPDNSIFSHLVKCLLAKIHDERNVRAGHKYQFQVNYRNGRPESAERVFDRISKLYTDAYKRYIDPQSTEADTLDRKEFSEEKVKTVVQALQGLSITKGAARNGDIIGAFFEEILRSGFKQDRGMYFTHDNLVKFMIEAIDLPGLTASTWEKSNHPDNRLPYIIDPACGSATFLLHAMQTVTETVRGNEAELVTNHDSEQFYNARLSDQQPNYWAENFIYGFDPKFIMAITAKVNMVLHGDGSAHVYKMDAFSNFGVYNDVRLRPASDKDRSVPRSLYAPEVCETFDVVVSNPPFGVTLSAETRKMLAKTFALSDVTPSEGLFIERAFQLLKPGGRLALVLPESILNSKDLTEVRMLLFRFFDIRAVVSLPRNLFIDTPTLTSLLFAQKKSAKAIGEWDAAWAVATEAVEKVVKTAAKKLTKAEIAGKSGEEVADAFVEELAVEFDADSWVSKSGKNPARIPLQRTWTDGDDRNSVVQYYREFMKNAGFTALKRQRIFTRVFEALGTDYVAYEVDEVGFKLSKRGEKARPNQLANYTGVHTKQPIQNLHLAGEEVQVRINTDNPSSVLDSIRKEVTWS